MDNMDKPVEYKTDHESDNFVEGPLPGATEDLTKSLRLPYHEKCLPISSLDGIEEVLENPPAWTRRILPLKERSNTVVQNIISDCHTELNKLVPKQRLDTRFVPKTLVCHDYKGGYLEDSQLTSTSKGCQYSFYNWNHIDIFVYFSHHLITIPPLCWINAAHVQGVKILGTFITEAEEGRKVCEKIFRDEDTMRIFATSLIQISKIFNFDGWLLNIENPLSDTVMLKKFVTYLTQSTHRDNPNNLIIWYDSIIETGELKWQNELNESNRYFFDHTDGIFLNYVWTEEKIKISLENAGSRPLDVYVGIDVFGRNTFGGGNFGCYKAAQIIRRYNMSMAIFAPGWTHETLSDRINKRKSFEDFVNRDSAFWNSLWPYLYTHPITELFRTNFFMGVNHLVYNIYGQQQQLSKIKHPSDFALVPGHESIPTINNKCPCIQCGFYEGGIRCLITKEFLNTTLNYAHHLFVCDLALSGTIRVHFLTRTLDNLQTSMNLIFLTCKRNGIIKKIKFNPFYQEHLTDDETLMEVNPTSDVLLLTHIGRLYRTMILKEDLSIFVYEFSVSPCNLLEIDCTLDGGNSIYLYAFGIEKVQ